VNTATAPYDNARTPRPLPLVAELARALEKAEIAYCHWKSNADLERSLSGGNDLDLLVLGADRGPFTSVLSELGFIHAAARREIPGIESYLGFDAESDRLVHVHAHYQLVLGDDRTKNYRLPIEEAYIASAREVLGLQVPAPELELVVLVARMTLKYCTWDEIAWSGLRGRRAGPTSRERRELAYLRARTSPESVAAAVEEHVPYVGRELFAACMRPLVQRVPAAERAQTARRLEIALQPYARWSRGADRARRIGGRVASAAARRLRRVPKRRLTSGGAMVGIMGGDGAGKSTALAELEAWLGRDLEVRVVHLGKPPWSATTYATRGALKATTAATDALSRTVGIAPAHRIARAVAVYRPLVWLLCTARDRRRTYLRARRLIARGAVVLSDRYPHPRLASMEAPLIPSRAEQEGVDGRLVQAMAVLEERYHRSIAPPELLVVLRLDPELAVSRKHSERPESVRSRGAEVWNIDWSASGAHIVDASQPLDAVVRELKKLVWSALRA
jgi:thymidylate kinase